MCTSLAAVKAVPVFFASPSAWHCRQFFVETAFLIRLPLRRPSGRNTLGFDQV
ncbi:MAG: hypothetical protein EG826_01255 [Deltaproteobacteria bacterium]|nr:hypothetical protein [Deltaproteobacteria bacterium]